MAVSESSCLHLMSTLVYTPPLSKIAALRGGLSRHTPNGLCVAVRRVHPAMCEHLKALSRSPCNGHRSHFGSRYKLGCCGHASLFGGLASAPSECQCIFLSVSLSLSMFLFVSVRASRRGLTAIQTAMPVAAWGSRFRMRSSQHQRRGRNI